MKFTILDSYNKKLKGLKRGFKTSGDNGGFLKNSFFWHYTLIKVVM